MLSVVLYIVIPVIIAQMVRRRLLASGGQPALDRLLRRLGPASLAALLATLVLLFGFQGGEIIRQPMVIALIAVPILIQVYFNAGLAYLLNRVAGEQHCVAGPSARLSERRTSLNWRWRCHQPVRFQSARPSQPWSVC